VGAGEGAQARGEGGVEGEAERQRPEELRRLTAEVEEDRGLHRLEEPPAHLAEGRGGPAPGRGVGPERDERAAGGVGQHEHVRAHAVAVVAGDRLGGARVGLGDGRLELGQVGHERGALGGELEPRAVVLLDEPSRLGEAPRQLDLRLLRHPPGDEAEGEDGGQHRHRRGGGEDARAEGGEGPRHHSTVKSASTTSPGAPTRTARRDRTCPSFQTARV
jgi:hypothetical protein